MFAGNRLNQNDVVSQAPEPSGLHQNAGNLTSRIWNASEIVERLRSRLLGPEPSGTQAGSKADREPSTVEFIDIAHQGMNRLEQQLNQLLNAIG